MAPYCGEIDCEDLVKKMSTRYLFISLELYLYDFFLVERRLVSLEHQLWELKHFVFLSHSQRILLQEQNVFVMVVIIQPNIIHCLDEVIEQYKLNI